MMIAFRNKLLVMYSVIGQLASTELNRATSAAYRKHLKTMFCVVLELTAMLRVKLSDSIYHKMKKNVLKYPASLVKKGDESKYTKYSEFTGIKKYNIPHKMEAVHKSGQELNRCHTHNKLKEGDFHQAYLHNVDDFFGKWMDLANLVQTFAIERGWERDYTVRNLIFCIGSELGELSDIVRFVDDSLTLTNLSPETYHSMVDEIADVTIFVMRFAMILGLDLNMVQKLLLQHIVEEL